jgi:hypothetical protein
MIRVEHNGVTYTVDTPEDAVKLGQLLAPKPAEHAEKFVWTPELFREFTDRLGTKQQDILRILLEGRGVVSDDDLRALIGVESNQALAGTLSGISQQATALGIPPRMVFTMKNFRKKHGQAARWNVYAVAQEFDAINIAINEAQQQHQQGETL